MDRRIKRNPIPFSARLTYMHVQYAKVRLYRFCRRLPVFGAVIRYYRILVSCGYKLAKAAMHRHFCTVFLDFYRIYTSSPCLFPHQSQKAFFHYIAPPKNMQGENEKTQQNNCKITVRPCRLSSSMLQSNHIHLCFACILQAAHSIPNIKIGEI